MRSWRLYVRTIIYCFIANLLATSVSYSASATFYRPVTISASDYSYDGQDVIVNGVQLTIDGSHQFNSIQLINNATLTHTASSIIPLTISSKTFFIEAGSSINLTSKGSLPTSAVTGSSAGSYGGLGGAYLGTTNPVFGNNKYPTDFGIGGRGSNGTTRGGGAIKITSNSLILNGSINASGQNFTTFFSSQGGGSGGSVWLDVETLSGAGTIQANGGSGFTFQGGGGGGGGRIAVYYKSTDFDLQNNIINEGGVCKPLFGEHGQSGSIYVENKSINVAPVADAGIARVINEQTEITLQGSATDTDGTIASFIWTQSTGPAVTLINANTSTPGFISPTILTADSPTVLNFTLTVTDDDGDTDTSETSVGVLAVNALPTISVGNDISVDELTVVTLSGSGQDSDGNVTAYQWQQVSGSPALLSNKNTSTATLTTPSLKISETLSFRLTVTDNEAGTASSEILVTVNPVNTLPIAIISAPGSAAENTIIMIDGSSSVDPDIDGSIVSYSWVQTGGPAVALNNITDAATYFTSPAVYQDTILSFRLDILDDEGGIATAETNVTIYSVNPDDDVDSMLDLWEIQFFGTLDNDGTLDSDNDGATDLQEYEYGTDPTVEQQPAQPEIVSPDDIEINLLQPLLTLSNPGQLPDFTVSYQYEIYSDASMSNLVITNTTSNLTLLINIALSDNTHYYWRARAVGITLYSEWVSSKFFVNTENDAPGAFNISYPQDGVWISSFIPTLSVTNSADVDEDALSYSFEIYIDGDLTQSPVTSVEGILPDESGTSSWTVNLPLEENNWYSWRAVVTDEHGLSTVSSSTPMIFINTVNDAPTTPALLSPLDNSEIITLYTDLSVNNAIDPEAEPIQYLFEIDTTNTFDSANKQNSGAINENTDTTTWSVNSLLDNSWYYWRAKASDGLAESPWANGRFFVNQFNDAPGMPTALNPGDNAWVGSLQPTLEVYPAVDIDGDDLSYEFNVYKYDKHGKNIELIINGNSNTTNWQLDMPLNESGYYYWHSRAIDEHGLAGEWGELVMFFSDDDGINDTPVIQLKYMKYEHGDVFAIHKYEDKDHKEKVGKEDSDKHDDDDKDKDSDKHDDKSFVEIKWKDRDPDSNARISLYFDSDSYGEDGVLIAQNILEDPDGQSDRFLWDISQVMPGIYFVYAIIDDGNSSSVEYSKNTVIIGDGGGLPFLTIKSSKIENEGKKNQRAKIEWQDLDFNSNASISLYYDTNKTGFDGDLIVSALNEDPDGNDDKFLWNVSALAEGKYFIYAIITDETNSYRVYAEEPFTIHHGQNGH